MIKRYPHTATIKINKEIDNGTGIPEIENKEISIKGRYEPTGQSKNIDYKAKFYCPKIEDLSFFQADGAKLIFNGKTFVIVNLFNYQTHCEIWLE